MHVRFKKKNFKKLKSKTKKKFCISPKRVIMPHLHSKFVSHQKYSLFFARGKGKMKEKYTFDNNTVTGVYM